MNISRHDTDEHRKHERYGNVQDRDGACRGRGERMRPITDTTPKPLIEVGGMPMLGRMLDMMARAGVEKAVVNAWHLADQIEAHLSTRKNPEITVVREDTLLDTGGGVANALPLLGEDAFFVANSDVVVLDGVEQAAKRLAKAWRDDEYGRTVALASYRAGVRL